ncbi:MAG: hypothetical protein K2G04_00585, partial [Oscillospiraceae bacterium]|nr:hypothetical protein [Oscillospiraceae bacterium]
DMNRLIYEKNIRYQFDEQTVEYYYDENGRLLKEIYIYNSELDESYITTVKYSYSDSSMIQQTYDTDSVLTNETEYAMIPKIKTDIEYKYYNDVKP